MEAKWHPVKMRNDVRQYGHSRKSLSEEGQAAIEKAKKELAGLDDKLKPTIQQIENDPRYLDQDLWHPDPDESARMIEQDKQVRIGEAHRQAREAILEELGDELGRNGD